MLHQYHFRKKLGFCVFICLLHVFGANKSLFGQGFNLVDIMYLESDHSEVYFNTNSVFADTSMILTSGASLVENSTQPRTFQSLLSAYSYTGNKLFQKHLNFPSCFGNNSGGYAELAKLGVHKYLMGGVGKDTTVRKSLRGIYKPYIYFFDNHGDSLSFFSLSDNIHDRLLYGVAVNSRKEIIGYGIEGKPTGFVDATEPWGGEFIADSSYFWIVKLDSAGNLLWHRSYNSFASLQWGAMTTKLIISPDETEYMIAGTVDYGNPYLLKTDSSGNEVWHRPLQLRESYAEHTDLTAGTNQCSLDIAAAPGGGYYFVSTTPYWIVYNANLDTASQLAFYYGKLSEDGDTVWTKQYQPYDSFNTNLGRQVRVAPNGDLIMSGNLYKKNVSNGMWESRTCIFRTDSLGNVIWYREPENYNMEDNHGFHTYHQLYGLALTPDHDGILAGGSYIGLYDPQHNSNMSDVNTYSWVILMDSLGRRCPEDTVMDVSYPCESIIFPLVTTTPILSEANFVLYPNPANNETHIRLESAKELGKGKLELRIYSIQGVMVEK